LQDRLFHLGERAPAEGSLQGDPWIEPFGSGKRERELAAGENLHDRRVEIQVPSIQSSLNGNGSGRVGARWTWGSQAAMIGLLLDDGR
jgi:hypothetical protein